MIKKKKIQREFVEEVCINDLKKIYIYIRNWKLLNPVPYVFKVDFKKIKELLN
jgi:hypothetical protein